MSNMTYFYDKEEDYTLKKLINSRNENGKIIKDFQDYKIKALITKESGETGGEAEKIEACIETDTEILVLERPKISYINCFENIEELVNRILNK